jgi:hypothetical protein
MERRSFLASLAAALGALALPPLARVAEAPVIEKSSRVPTLWGDGVHDDTVALQALLDGERIWFDGRLIDVTDDWVISGHRFRLNDAVFINGVEHIGKQRRRGTLVGNAFFWR